MNGTVCPCQQKSSKLKQLKTLIQAGENRQLFHCACLGERAPRRLVSAGQRESLVVKAQVESRGVGLPRGEERAGGGKMM